MISRNHESGEVVLSYCYFGDSHRMPIERTHDAYAAQTGPFHLLLPLELWECCVAHVTCTSSVWDERTRSGRHSSMLWSAFHLADLARFRHTVQGGHVWISFGHSPFSCCQTSCKLGRVGQYLLKQRRIRERAPTEQIPGWFSELSCGVETRQMRKPFLTGPSVLS
jgi:hypothetical protein